MIIRLKSLTARNVYGMRVVCCDDAMKRSKGAWEKRMQRTKRIKGTKRIKNFQVNVEGKDK